MADKRRKAIPDRVKLMAALRAMGLTIEEVQFDHQPALALREFDPATGDTIPPANSPDHIVMLTVRAHKEKTFGRGGEKRITTAGSDIGNISKVRRLTKQQTEFRDRLLRKANADTPEDPPKRKSKWPTRPFNRNPKKGQST